MMLRWLGLGRSPVAIGVEPCDDALVVAMVRNDPIRVVGLGRAELSAGAVTRGDIREPHVLSTALADLLRPIHFAARPKFAFAVQPELTAAATATTAPVHDLGPIGHVAVCSRLLRSARSAVPPTGVLSHIDSAPIALVRFSRAARPEVAEWFARGGAPDRPWSTWSGHEHFELEAIEAPSQSACTTGPDLASLAEPTWSSLVVDSHIRDRYEGAQEWSIAVGAAIGCFGIPPFADLAGPLAIAETEVPQAEAWTLERVG